jgi:hypothetical protein
MKFSVRSRIHWVRAIYTVRIAIDERPRHELDFERVVPHEAQLAQDGAAESALERPHARPRDPLD